MDALGLRVDRRGFGAAAAAAGNSTGGIVVTAPPPLPPLEPVLLGLAPPPGVDGRDAVLPVLALDDFTMAFTSIC